jgi:hypothetical protein
MDPLKPQELVISSNQQTTTIQLYVSLTIHYTNTFFQKSNLFKTISYLLFFEFFHPDKNIQVGSIGKTQENGTKVKTVIQ